MYKTEGRDDGSGSNNNGNGGGAVPVAHTCIICEMVYGSANALLDHMRSAHEALMDFSGSVIEIYVSMMNEKANQDSNGSSSSSLATKRGRSSSPVRRPNPSMTSFLIYYPCCLCRGVFRSPDHRERHAWGCEGRIRLPRRPRSSVSVPPSSYVRAVRRKAALNLNQSLPLRDTPLRRSNRKTERNKAVMKRPVSPDNSVCREFNLNRRWRHEDDDEDNAPFNASIAKLHNRSYT